MPLLLSDCTMVLKQAFHSGVFTAVIIILSAAGWQYATALPSGAPLAACGDMIQQHADFELIECDGGSGFGCPFQLTLIAVDGEPVAAGDSLVYTCGAQHTFRLDTIVPSQPFRGFAVQSRKSTPTFSSDAPFLGQFVNAPSDGDWRLWACDADSATHTSRSDKRSVNLTWQAPEFPSGNITFWFSITRTFVDIHAQLRGPELAPNIKSATDATPSVSSTPDVTMETDVTTETPMTPPETVYNFFPFGPSVNDSVLPTSDDDASDEIVLDTEFIFYGESRTSLYVNTNGVLSFIRAVPLTRPRSFPFPSPPLIAPFFSDVDLFNGGTVYYRQTADIDLLSQAGFFINSLTDLSDFNPSLLFIATWYRVGPHLSVGETGENTFQVVLATDGETSMVGFLYGTMLWGADAEIGFNAGDGVTFLSVPPPGVDPRDIETNVGILGVFIYQVDDLELETTPSTDTTTTPPTNVTTETPMTTPPDPIDIPSNFFPFGPAVSDATLPTGDDDFSDEILFNTEFVFFGRNHTLLFVNTNGVLSFMTPHPATFPRMFPIQSPPLIAPFFHDINLFNSGTVYYRQTEDIDLLSQTGFLINSLTNLSDFNPSLLFIATWYRVGPHLLVGETGENTFQVVLATDGETSVVGFIYGDIQWGEDAEIGFNAGDGVTFLGVPPPGVDTRDIESQSNVDVPGVFIYQVDALATETPISTTAEPPVFVVPENFLPFGPDAGDSIVPAEDDVTSSEIIASTDFVFYGRRERVLFVSSNGLLSFDTSYHLPGPREFPIRAPPLVAPYFHDANPSIDGSIFYRLISDPDFIASFIANISTLPLDDHLLNFEPTLLFIATWYRVPQFGEVGPNRNTFQVVLATDGETTTVTFIYGDIQWGEGAEIGFNAGDGLRSLRVPSSGTSETVDIENQSNVGLPGLFLFKVDDLELETPSTTTPPTTDVTMETPMTTLPTETPGPALENFLPFGPAENDSVLPTSDDGGSEEIQLETEFVLFEQKHTSFFVNTNGVMSFGSSYRQPGPNSFPLPIPLVAPFYHDINLNRGGTVYYRQTSDADLIDTVRTRIAELSDIQDFNPSLLVIVTWERVSAFSASLSGENTFQAVLATDGNTSVVSFIYGDIQWGPNAEIGFNAGDDVSFFRLPSSGTSATIDIEFQSNVNVTGLFIYRVDDLELETPPTSDVTTETPMTTLPTETPPGLENFLPFGPAENDSVLPTSDDGGSEEIQLETEFVLFEQNHTSFFVNTNGVISFGSFYRLAGPNNFPLPIPLVAPFYHDINLNRGGTVYYRQTSDADLIDTVRTRIAELSDIQGFNPSLLVIVTWERVGPFSLSLFGENTFQTVLATDGNTSVVSFIYGDIQWGPNAEIGFNAGDGMNFFRLPSSGTSATIDIEFQSNVNVTGLFIYRVDDLELETPPTSDVTTETPMTTLPTETPPGLENFLPFGPAENDSVLPTSDDGGSEEIQLETEFVLFEQNHTSFFVNTNGVISFGSFYRLAGPNNFPLPIPFVAPFYHDINLHRGGTVYYRQTSDADLIDTVRTRIAELSDIQGFNPSLLVIVTWERVGPFSLSLFGENTFQTVLATDGNISVVSFIYGDIQWGPNAEIGFNAGDDVSFFRLPSSGTSATIDIEFQSNVNVTGLFIYRVDDLELETPPTTDVTTETPMTTLPTETPPGLENFLPFGPAENDSVLPTSDDGGSEEIQLETEFVLFEQNHTSFFVNTNGVISFGSPYRLAGPNSFPLPIPLVAPFYHDINLNRGGTVYYRQTSDADLIDTVRTRIAELSDIQDFNPSLLVIVTWERVSAFSRFSSGENTFQAVLATDGNTSVVSFIYGDIQWGPNAEIGFNAGDGMNFFRLPSSGTSATIDIEFQSNVNVTGLFIYRVDDLELETPPTTDVTTETPMTTLPTETPPALENFLPFGPAENDSVLPTSDDGGSEEIQLETEFVLFEQNHTSFFVNTNGVMSFGSSYRQPGPNSFPLPIPLVAPFYHDINLNRGGTVYYRQTSDADLIDTVRTRIAELSDIQDFNPSLLVIVTWERVSAFSASLSGENTFQAVLATDGNTSVVSFIYGDIQWGPNAEIGFNAGDDVSFFRLPSSGTSATIDIEFQSNVNVTGLFIYRVDDLELETPPTTDVTTETPMTTLPTETPPGLENFLPFGPAENDSVLPTSDDGGSEEIQLETEFVLFERNHTSFFVNTNGVMSFGSSYRQPGPNSFPLPIPLVAPFYHDINLNRGGTVYYRQTSDADLIDTVRTRIAELSDIQGFNPSLLVIVTWERVGPFSASLSGENTFQAVLATDGNTSVVSFIYGDIQWGPNAEIGFNAGDGMSFFRLPSSGTSATIDIEFQSNVNVTGLFIYRVDDLELETPPSTDTTTTPPITDVTTETPMTTLPTETPGPALENFLPFGPAENDSVLPTSDDGGSEEIQLETEFVLFEQKHTSFFVNTNGVISFGSPYRLAGPNSFPLPIPLVAPFYHDINLNRGGTVYYRQTSDADIIDTVRARIAELSDIQDFNPSLLVIVTWERVSAFSRFSSGENTFQAVLATDGNTSVVSFIYGDIQWGRNAEIGFNAGDDVSFFRLPSSGTSATIDIEFQSNVNVTGLFIYRVDDLELETPPSTDTTTTPPTTDVTTEIPMTTLPTETPPGLENFLPFGPAENDSVLPTSDDGTSEEIHLETEFVLFERNHTSFFVNTNGVISFGSSYRRPGPNSFPLPIPLVAPFYHDINLHRGGTVYYRQTSDADLIDTVRTRIAELSDIQDFNPSLLVIVTWERVSAFSASLSGENTFQAVLATDGNTSVVSFIYGDIQWGPNAEIGFNAGDDMSFFRLPSSGTSATIDIEFQSNVNVTGLFIYRVDDLELETPPTTDVTTETPMTTLPTETPPGLENFLPFGPAENDSVLPTSDDGGSEEIQLETEFVLFEQKHTSFFVNTNGVISFGSPYRLAGPNNFPLPIPLVAPFYHDINLHRGGTVYYRQTSDADLIDTVRARIAELSDIQDFNPSLLVIVTWERVGPFSLSFFGENTFQTVLATDGNSSVVSFIYGDIQWGPNAEIGFNAGDSVSFFRLPFARTTATVDIEFQSNVNIPGLFIYRVDDLDTAEITFLPFGPGEGDSRVGSGDDIASPVIQLRTEFVFFGRKETNIYVNINGVLSFNETYTIAGPRRFPLISPPLIAPFYHDIITENDGNIFYRQTSDPISIALYIASVSTLPLDDHLLNFEPTLLFIATWDRVPQYGEDGPNRNTFQAVLATDGETSTVSLRYGDIQWGDDAEVGFNRGDGTSFFRIPLSVPTTDISVQSNVGVPGLFLYRVDQCLEGDLRVTEAVPDVQLNGRVLTFEVCSDGVFGRVCDQDWDDEDATIVCNSQGYTAPAFSARADSSPRFVGNVSSEIVAQNVMCNGTRDVSFTNCTWNRNISSECLQRDSVASVQCIEVFDTFCIGEETVQTNPIFDTYEIDGEVFSVVEGVFEVCLDGRLGSVCDIGWSDSDAAVICNDIGFPSPQYVPEALFGFELGSSQRYIGQNFVCNGTETSLPDCLHERNISSECNNGPHVAGYRCREVPLPCTEGEVRLTDQIFGGTTFFPDSVFDQFDSGYINVSARVEICRNGVFGAVCDSGWDEVDAQVVCNMFGYNEPYYRGVPVFGQYSDYQGPIHYQDVLCTGDEATLSSCNRSLITDLSCNNASRVAGVQCIEELVPCFASGSPLNTRRFNTRRTVYTNGSVLLSTRVDVCFNGTYGSICDVNWDQEDALAFCRDEFRSDADATAVRGSQFGVSAAGIVLEDVRCDGREDSLSSCTFSELGLITDRRCSDPGRAAGVVCFITCFTGATRIRDSPTLYEGRVEVCSNNQWGTICDIGWDDLDASVVCRRNSFFEGVAVPGGVFPPGPGPIVASGVTCTGSEFSVSECANDTIINSECTHDRDAGIRCTPGIIIMEIVDENEPILGSDYTIQCNAVSFPWNASLVSYDWNNGTLSSTSTRNISLLNATYDNQRLQFIFNSSIQFIPLTLEDVGVYTCGLTLNITLLYNFSNISLGDISNATSFTVSGIAPRPHFIAVGSSEPRVGENFTASCIINVTTGLNLNTDVINIQWLNSFGIPLSITFDRRMRVEPVRQINEEQFARDLVISPLSFVDAGNYTCEAAIEGPFLTSESIDIDFSLTILDDDEEFSIECSITLPSPLMPQRVECEAFNGEVDFVNCIYDEFSENCSLSFDIDVTRFTPGLHTLIVAAFSTDGQLSVIQDEISFFVPEPLPFITLLPSNDITISIDSDDNVTYTCTVDQGRLVLWEIDGVQIFDNSFTDLFDIIIENTPGPASFISSLTLTAMARQIFFEIMKTQISVQCNAFTVGPPPEIEEGPRFMVIILPSEMVELRCFPAVDARLILLSCFGDPDPVHNATCAVDEAVPEPCDVSRLEIDQFSFGPGIHVFTINFINTRGLTGQTSFNFTGFDRPRIDIQIIPSAGSVGEGFQNSFIIQLFGFSYNVVPIRIVPLSYDQYNELGTGIDLSDLFNANLIPTDAATPGVDFNAREGITGLFAGDPILPFQDLVRIQTYVDGVRDNVEGYVVLFLVDEEMLDERDRGQVDISGSIQLAVIVPGSTMFEILIGDVELGQRSELLDVAIQPVENFVPFISVTEEQQTVIATDFASLIIDWSVWVQQTFSNPSNYSFEVTKTLIDSSGAITGPTTVLSLLTLNNTLIIDPVNGVFELFIPEYNPLPPAVGGEDSDNGIYMLEGCQNRGTPNETCSSADITLFGIIIPFDIDCRPDRGLLEITVTCVANLPAEVEFQCFYDDQISVDCDSGFISIDLSEFSAETHTLRVIGIDLRGFSDSFDLEFEGLNVNILPPTRLSYYVLDPIDPAARPRTVFIPESGVTDARGIVQVDGPIIRNITIQLVPLTYDEYEARFPSINLNNVFPSRPLPAESGDFSRRPLVLNFVDERQDRQLIFPQPVNDSETELSEGFLYLLEVDGQRTDPLDLDRLQILNNIILVVIEDDDEFIDCSSSVDDDVVTFTCTDIELLPPEVSDNLECSINFASPEPCLFPYQVALSQLAPGGSNLRVLSRMAGEPIPDEILGGAQFELPRLEVFFVNNTPILDVDRLYAEFETNRPGVSVECHLTHLDNSRVDCSDGVFEMTGIPPGDYTLRVVARDLNRPRERRAVARNRIWVHGDDEFCVVVLQNRARTINGNSVTFEFEGTGLTTNYKCILDRTEFVDCSSPYTIENVPIGEHHFKVIPQGCGRNFRAHPQKFNIN